jgi:HK97 family phage major capsid protein
MNRITRRTPRKIDHNTKLEVKEDAGTATLMTEMAKTMENIQKAWHEHKSANDERLKILEKKGSNSSELEEKIAKIAKDLDKGADEVKKLHAAMNRTATGGGSANQEQQDADEIEVKAMFRDFMKKGEHTNGQAFRIEKKAMSVISDPDGGFMVTSDMSGRTVQKIFETSPMRQIASVQAISTDALEGDYDLDEASSGWVGELSSRPETSTPTMKKWRIPVFEQYAMPKVTQRLLDDANFNPEEWLSGKVADKFARVENDAFTNGDGVNKPRGFLTYPAGTTLPTQIEQKNSGTNGAPVADTLIDLVYLLKGYYRNASAQFLMNRLTQAAVRKLKDSQNQYLWSPTQPTGGLTAGQAGTLLGFGVTEAPDMPVPATNSLSIAFGNFKEGYQIVDRTGIRILRDPYTSKGFILFYTTKRVGGDVVNHEAIKIYKFST